MRSQHALFGSNNYILEKCTSRMFYQRKLKLLIEKPTAQSNIEQKLPDLEIDWSKTYSYARRITLDSHSRIFFYKLINNILHLNASLTHIGHFTNPLCSYCNLQNEVPTHLFYECQYTQRLWTELQNHFRNALTLPNLTKSSALFGLPFNTPNLIKHIHLIFLMAIYKNRKIGKCSVVYIKNKIKFTKKIEKNMNFFNANQRNINALKWAQIN